MKEYTEQQMIDEVPEIGEVFRCKNLHFKRTKAMQKYRLLDGIEFDNEFIFTGLIHYIKGKCLWEDLNGHLIFWQGQIGSDKYKLISKFNSEKEDTNTTSLKVLGRRYKIKSDENVKGFYELDHKGNITISKLLNTDFSRNKTLLRAVMSAIDNNFDLWVNAGDSDDVGEKTDDFIGKLNPFLYYMIRNNNELIDYISGISKTVPTEIKHLAVTFDIEIVDKISRTQSLLGLYDYKRSLISIAKDISETQIKATLMHEIVHSFDYMVNHESPFLTEQSTDIIAQALVAFIRDNPKFIKSIQEEE